MPFLSHAYKRCGAITLDLESGEIEELFTITAKNPVYIIDSNGKYDTFGVITEMLGGKSVVGVINYKSGAVKKLWEGYNISPGIIVHDDERAYYFFNSRFDGLFRIDLMPFI